MSSNGTPIETMLNKPRDELELVKILSAKGVTQNSVALYLKEKEDCKETDTLVSAIQDLHFQIDLQIKLVSTLQETLREKGLEYEKTTSEIDSLKKITSLLGELERSNNCTTPRTEDVTEQRMKSPRSSKSSLRNSGNIMMLNEKDRLLINDAIHDLISLRQQSNNNHNSNNTIPTVPGFTNATDATRLLESPRRRIGITDSPRRLLNSKSTGALMEPISSSSFDKIKSLLRPTK